MNIHNADVHGVDGGDSIIIIGDNTDMFVHTYCTNRKLMYPDENIFVLHGCDPIEWCIIPQDFVKEESVDRLSKILSQQKVATSYWHEDHIPEHCRLTLVLDHCSLDTKELLSVSRQYGIHVVLCTSSKLNNIEQFDNIVLYGTGNDDYLSLVDDKKSFESLLNFVIEQR